MVNTFDQLAAPFPPEAVSWRVGVSNKKKVQRETGNQNAKATKGQVLAYIDARDVMDRFDAVCGPEGWQNRYTHADKKTVCEIGVKVGDEWVWKADGAGDSDIEAEKGSLSDAFKRAAVRWGVGRYLYNLPTPWVDLDEWEQIPQRELERLRGILRKEAPRRPADNALTAAQLAIKSLKSYANDKATFLEFWTKNYQGWKGVMSDDEYAEVVAEMQRINATFPKAKKPAADEFGLNGDNVPEFA